MKKFFADRMGRFPVTYFIVVGIGGAYLIMALLNTYFYHIAEEELARILRIVSAAIAVVWAARIFIKIKLLLHEKELKRSSSF